MKTNEIVVVLGMHRSGTSLLTKAIVDMGYFPGTQLMKSNTDNPTGFWEDLRIVDLNDRIMKEFGLNWYSVDNPNKDRFSRFLDIYLNKYIGEAIEVIQELLFENSKIVIKDPRMVITLPFWDKVFNQFDAEVKTIIIYRDPIESSESINRRNKFDKEVGLKLWLYYNAMLLKNIRVDSLVISHMSFYDNPMLNVDRIGKFLCVDETIMNNFPKDFLDKKLRHHINIENDFSGLKSIELIYNELFKWSNLDIISSEAMNLFYEENKNCILEFIDEQSNVREIDQYTMLVYDDTSEIIDRVEENIYEGLVSINYLPKTNSRRILLFPSEVISTITVANQYITVNGLKEELIILSEELSIKRDVYFLDNFKQYFYFDLPVNSEAVSIKYIVNQLDERDVYFLKNIRTLELDKKLDNQIKEKNQEIEQLKIKNEKLDNAKKELQKMINDHKLVLDESISGVYSKHEAEKLQLLDIIATSNEKYNCIKNKYIDGFIELVKESNERSDTLTEKLNQEHTKVLELSIEMNNLTSKMVEHDKEIQYKNEMIESLEKQLNENNLEFELSKIKHIDVLDLSIKMDNLTSRMAGYDKEIQYKNEMLESLEKQLNENNLEFELTKNKHTDVLNELEKKTTSCKDLTIWGSSLHEEIKVKDNLLDLRNEEISQLSYWGKGIEQELNVVRMQLNTIYDNKAWKLLNKLEKGIVALFPIQSKRRLFLKLCLYFLKHPFKFLKCFIPKNINFFYSNIKVELPTLFFTKFTQQLSKKKKENYVPEEADVPKLIEETSEIVIPTFANIIVSIIIPAYNQYEMNMNCIKAIVENTLYENYEIIFVDDVSSDETKKIEKNVRNLNVLRNDKNQGFLLNCNNGAKLAKGKYLFFLNNDTQVQKGWLSPLVSLIESDSKIGMVGSKLIYPDGSLQEAGGILWKDGSAWNFGRNDDASKPEYNYVRETDYISGAAIMIRKKLWENIGGFDERYVPAYCEDSDLAFEVRKNGYKVLYQPKSVVVHFEGKSNGLDTESGLKKYQVINQEKFFEKWKYVLEKEHYTNGRCLFHAKGKTQSKKTILVIDHYVPQYDKDAGSRTMYMYLKLFVDMGYNVKFLGDNFYPHQPYTNELEEYGIEVLYGPWYYENYKEWIKENGQYFDYVYLWRPHISQKYVDIIRDFTDAIIMYYVVDLHFLREIRQFEIEKKEELRISSEKWKKIEGDIIDKSDLVLTISQDERKIIEDEFNHKNVKVFPAFFYDSVNRVQRNETKNLLFVGGFAHTPNVDGVLWFINDILPIVLKSIPNIVLNIVGSNPPEEVIAMSSANVSVKGFVSDSELSDLYTNSRVSVIPLRFGAGVKGKTVEAMFNGLPIVSTQIGIEGLPDLDRIIKSQNTEKEFAEEIVRLYSLSDGELQKKSDNEQKYIEEHFTRKSAMTIFEDILGGEFE